MKKAFMRGVCALNMEAMSMWNVDEQAELALELPRSVAIGVRLYLYLCIYVSMSMYV